jgi:hypothetical protein
MWSLLAVYGTVEVVVCCKEGYANLGMDTMGGYKMRWPAVLWFLGPAGMYVAARMCLVFEVVVSMRALPRGAFVEVQWSALVPHI